MHRLNAPARYISPLWKEIAGYYSAKDRHYHNLNHLADLFSQADYFKKHIEDFDTFQLSIWYHDIIYNCLRKDNEEKSALFAKYRLEAINFPREKLVRCYQQINATKFHQIEGDDADTAWLLDFDLSILGRKWPVYYKYTQQIRKEYAIFPSFLYNRGRKKVLQGFLKKDRLFHTDQYFTYFEKLARENIQKELDLLILEK
jgi:predicted metal-dependent HD superfamily phosphohydrolase